jgi:hypothetical protein
MTSKFRKKYFFMNIAEFGCGIYKKVIFCGISMQPPYLYLLCSHHRPRGSLTSLTTFIISILFGNKKHSDLMGHHCTLDFLRHFCDSRFPRKPWTAKIRVSSRILYKVRHKEQKHFWNCSNSGTESSSVNFFVDIRFADFTKFFVNRDIVKISASKIKKLRFLILNTLWEKRGKHKFWDTRYMYVQEDCTYTHTYIWAHGNAPGQVPVSTPVYLYTNWFGRFFSPS